MRLCTRAARQVWSVQRLEARQGHKHCKSKATKQAGYSPLETIAFVHLHDYRASAAFVRLTAKARVTVACGFFCYRSITNIFVPPIDPHPSCPQGRFSGQCHIKLALSPNPSMIVDRLQTGARGANASTPRICLLSVFYSGNALRCSVVLFECF
jgi:hypothetical protein